MRKLIYAFALMAAITGRLRGGKREPGSSRLRRTAQSVRLRGLMEQPPSGIWKLALGRNIIRDSS